MSDRRPEDDAEALDRELRRSGQVFMAELDRLHELEAEKQAATPGDERRVSLARQVEDLAVDVMTLSRYQTRMIELQTQSLGGPEVLARSPAVVLEAWRAAERHLRDSRMAMERATDEANRLRDEHRRSLSQREA